jgi:hypothetical protein
VAAKHGINGWTGEPRDQYLALIARRHRRRGDREPAA